MYRPIKRHEKLFCDEIRDRFKIYSSYINYKYRAASEYKFHFHDEKESVNSALVQKP